MNLRIISIVLFFIYLNNNTYAQNSTALNTNKKLSKTTVKASVVSLIVSGKENNYKFNVGVSSPDTGCDQYANWWEIITEDGTLLYRRILAHSHINEQPFVRSGPALKIKANKTVYIRAHMNSSGYGTKVYKGSVNSGFKPAILSTDFSSDLENMQPQPGKCRS